MSWIYVNCEVAPAELGAAVNGARAMGWAGFHRSIPHKVAVIEHLDELGRSATLIGAVNTVVRRGDAIVGENTDGLGFVSALTGVMDIVGASLVILGAGGAARAVAVESALAGAERITVVSRRLEPAQSLVETIERETVAIARAVRWGDDLALGTADLLVNATPVGMAPDVAEIPEIDLQNLDPASVVADLVPNPAKTDFLAAAEAMGHAVLDGTGMLVNQAIESVRLWSGKELDSTVMRAALEEALGIPSDVGGRTSASGAVAQE
jgi:shikimate dehydrogenase